MPRLEGTTLSHYRLKHLLGKGGMSEVYLAYDEQQNADVAVKVVDGNQTEYVERFQREVTAMKAFTHDHILPVLASGQDGSWHYLVMPYLEHGTLRERLKRLGPLTMEEAGVILEQVASALQYAHERGMLHRDIKSSNILLRDEQFVYLADFGLAKALEEKGGITRTGYVMGTVEYMAPELAEEPASTNSDLYAVSILLYEMLTGNVPFQGSTSLAVYLKQMVEQPVRPSLLNPALSFPIEQVILRALEKDPHLRFQTPQALAQAYRQALQVPEQAPTFPVLVPNPSIEAAAVTVPFFLQRLQSWLRYLPSNTRTAIVVLPMLVLLLVPSLSLAFFVYSSSQTPSTQGIRGASVQFDTTSVTKQPQVTPQQQNIGTGKMSTSIPATQPPQHKNGKRHKHGNGD